MYQNLTGHWESWAYAWLLYPVFLGLALQFIGQRTGEQGTYNTGSGFVRYGGIAFIIAAALFELLIFGGGGFLGGLALPLILIGLGGVLLLRGGTSRSRKTKNDDAPLFTGATQVGTHRARTHLASDGGRPHAQAHARLRTERWRGAGRLRSTAENPAAPDFSVLSRRPDCRVRTRLGAALTA
jgi:hypothetical protein